MESQNNSAYEKLEAIINEKASSVAEQLSGLTYFQETKVLDIAKSYMENSPIQLQYGPSLL